MKKIITFLVLLASIFGITSCSKQEKITLKRDVTITESIDLYATDPEEANLKELKDNKESFLLYGYIPGCSTCAMFSEVYENYVKENKVVLYKSTVSDVMVLEDDAPTMAPYLAIYRNGEMSKVFTYAKHKSIFTNPNDFEKLIDKYFVFGELETMINIEKDELDKKISNNEEFVVYFGWNKCGDCSFMNEVYLEKFLKENDKLFYYFETDPYHPSKDATIEETNAWKEFKLKYGFGSYEEGRVPSICYYKDGKCEEFAVYLNDILEYNEETISFKVISSFYKDNPNINKEFKGASKLEAYENYKEASKDFFNTKMDEFFNKNLK